ncbi:MAG: hypothetical protein Q9218_003109 [Villophora microphyllina]
MGYRPVIDSYETFVGSSWTSRREVLVWGAGAELVIRVKWKGPELEEEWLRAVHNNEDVASFDQRHHKVRWWRVKNPGHQDGRDDITAIKLLRDSQKPSSSNEYVIVGRATGELTMISIDHALEGLWQREAQFSHGGQTVRFAAVSSAIEPFLATCIGDHTLAIYTIRSDKNPIEPLQLIHIEPLDKTCRLWSTIFLRRDRLAVGLGPSTDPIQVFEVVHEATPSKPFRTFSVKGEDAEAAVKWTVYSLAPLPPSSRGHKLESDFFLSGGYDGVVRLHDLQSSCAYVATFTDPVDPFSAIYSLLPLSCNRFLAGSANHSLLKVFDLRVALEKYCRNQSPSGYAAEKVAWRESFFQRYPRVGSDALSSRTDEKVTGGWNVFLANRHQTAGPMWRTIRDSASSVYSLSSPSICSPTFYAGIEGNVIQVDLTAANDNFPDPILKLAPKPKSKRFQEALRKKNYDGDVMCLAMYEQVTGAVKLKQQVGIGEIGNNTPGWDLGHARRKPEICPATTRTNTFYFTIPDNLIATNTKFLSGQRATCYQLKWGHSIHNKPKTPILNLQDTRVDAPFFGANSWTGILKPVAEGGIPPHHIFVKLSMTFKDGGAFDFATTYERIKETISQAVDLARESGRQQGPDLSDINLEQLPAYEEVGSTVAVLPPTILHQPTPISPISSSYAPSRDSGVVLSSDDERNSKPAAVQGSVQHYPPPDEPPPGYEEVQQTSVAENLEHNLRIEH